MKYPITYDDVIVYKLTTDDWCPSYTLSLGVSWGKVVPVVLCVVGNPGTSQGWRVAVWGADDCGMEKDFTTREEARTCFFAVVELPDVTMKILREMGFVSA